MAEVIRGYCPHGCKEAHDGRESDFDLNGYCRHLVGFLNLVEGESPAGKLFETLEPIQYPERDGEGKPTGRKIHSGLMRTNGRNRQPILAGDTVVTPLELQQRLTQRDGEGRIISKPKLGVAARIYRADGKTEVMVNADDTEKEKRLRRIEDLQATLAEEQRLARAADFARKEGDASDAATEKTAAENAASEKNSSRRQPAKA